MSSDLGIAIPACGAFRIIDAFEHGIFSESFLDLKHGLIGLSFPFQFLLVLITYLHISSLFAWIHAFGNTL